MCIRDRAWPPVVPVSLRRACARRREQSPAAYARDRANGAVPRRPIAMAPSWRCACPAAPRGAAGPAAQVSRVPARHRSHVGRRARVGTQGKHTTPADRRCRSGTTRGSLDSHPRRRVRGPRCAAMARGIGHVTCSSALGGGGRSSRRRTCLGRWTWCARRRAAGRAFS